MKATLQASDDHIGVLHVETEPSDSPMVTREQVQILRAGVTEASGKRIDTVTMPIATFVRLLNSVGRLPLAVVPPPHPRAITDARAASARPHAL